MTGDEPRVPPVGPGPQIRPGQTPLEAAEAARAMAARRWAAVSPAERSEAMRRVRHTARTRRVYGPVDPAQARCACGRMTLARATARADKSGTGLGHARGCPFYRRQRRRGKRRPLGN